MEFYVRVDVTENLVMEALEKETPAPLVVFREKLSSYIKVFHVDTIYSFMTVEVEDETVEKVETHLRETWNLCFPGYENAITVYVTAKDNSELSEDMLAIYNAYFGWEDYLRFVTDFTDEVPLLKEKNGFNHFRMMNFLVSIDSGCGMSQLLSSFSEYLLHTEVFPKKKESNLEYIIDNDEDHGYTKANDFIDALWDEDEYNQVVSVDISYYLQENKTDELRNFLKRLDKLQDHYIFLFRIPYLSDKPYQQIRNTIADLLPIYEFRMKPYSNLELRENAVDIILKCDYKTTIEADNVIQHKIELEKMDGRFYGMKTSTKVANEAIMAKVKQDVMNLRRGKEPDKTLITAEDLAALAPTKNVDNLSGFEELDQMIGMEEIHKKIEEIVAQVKISLENTKMDRPSLHMRFTGAPGTGKTTVARIIGKIFREQGILRKGNFFEFSARSLCAEYVGQTAPRTAQICRDAYGSVLFLDEAYSLYAKDASGNDYGKEAITTLIAEMENHRDDLVVIMAGYTNDMDELMEANSGLRSRMPFILEFKNYTKEQLAQIYIKMARRHFTLEEGLEEDVTAYFNSLSQQYMSSREFANARFVRNLYERTWSKAALRASEKGTSSAMLLREDFKNATLEKEFSEKLVSNKMIGFQ